MIDDIIKLLLAMPPLDLTSDANIELLRRTNQLGDDLTLASFKHHLSLHPKSVFTHSQRNIIFNFLTHWQSITKELNLFVHICNACWQETHLSLMGGDDVLPLYICLMPTDKNTLEKLHDVLTIAININPMSYHLMVMHGAVRHLLQRKEGDDETGLYDKAYPVAENLKTPEHFVFLYIAVRFSKFLRQRKRICTDEIFDNLKQLQIHDYDVNESPENKGAYLHYTQEKILEMTNHLEQTPLNQYPELIAKIKKFVAYHELYAALQRAKFPITRKLTELTSKFEIFKLDLAGDLDNVYINVPVSIQHLLELPPVKRNYISNFINNTVFTPTTHFPLLHFMTHLSIKLDTINIQHQINQEAAAALSVIIPDATREDPQNFQESAGVLHAMPSLGLPR